LLNGGFAAEKYPLILTEIGFSGANDVGAHIPVIRDESYGDAITKYTAEKRYFLCCMGVRSSMGAKTFYRLELYTIKAGEIF